MAEQTNTAPRIKQERLDEREINQLAQEMVEKNKQKMISQAAQIAQQNQASQQALQRAGGQQMITFYFNRDKSSITAKEDSLVPNKVEEKKKGTIDEESQRGRFGWSTIHNAHIPYLFRREDKYCAVRMVETKLLNKYLNFLPHEITTCIHVRSYFITEGEAKLLNEINMKHCEFQFGRDLFTTKDLVVRLHDARCFYKFLDTCFKKLVQKSPEQSEHCGFVRINDTLFEDWWPQKTAEPMKVNSPGTKLGGIWTQRPPAVAAAAAASAYTGTPNMQALLSGLTMEQMRRLQPQVSLPATTPLIPTISVSRL
ncbi:hypothetical protein C7M84_007995 [Penaeus vannamei]|uniref:Uncharacterized protein n=1 Tax=Penaeus vannamei TaxID=6689 RepID=A0A423TAT6_PENVA|nr:hypothetical protein C7M84_007995 [Penaeus vannamei]